MTVTLANFLMTIRADTTTTTTAGHRVWSCVPIMEQILTQLGLDSCEPMRLSCRQGWLYGTKHLWTAPLFTNMTEFARFATAITRTPLFQLEFAACYGVLVKTLDLSNVGGRENNVNHAMVAHVLTFCPNLECIDLSLCRNISDAQFIRLFADNPHISRKLKSLNLDKISIGDEAMGQTVCLLPNLIHLRLSETNAGPLTCIAIGSCLFELRSLGIASCDLIDDSCLVAVAKGCKKLRHIKIKGCSNIQTDDAEDLMALHRCFPYVSDGSDNEYDDDTGTIIDDIANDPLLHMFFGNGEHSVRSINELVYSAMDTSD